MTLSVLVLVAALGEAEARQDVPPGSESAGSCQVCHADVMARRSATAAAHADLACSDCHPGRSTNPHVPPEQDAATSAAAAFWAPVAAYSAAAYTQCDLCHHDEVASFRASVHGQEPDDGQNAHKPSCTSCHGDIHAVMSRASATGPKRAMAERCSVCHGFAETGKVPTSPFVVDTYRDTVHGKMLHLGNERAAACADCHTGHRVFSAADPRASVHPANRVKTCAACHPGASESFAGAISHTPPRLDRDFWSWLVSLAFGLLTAGTITLLFVHIVLDFLRMARGAPASAAGHAHQGPAAADDEVERFDIHARIQHWGMMAAFIALVFTGWPLKVARLEAANDLVRLFGGQQVTAVIHRVAGALLLAVAVYHLVYLFIRAQQGRLSFAIVPSPQDVRDLAGNIAYFLGLQKERPRFGRWTYYEKFDYWAVFWGMAIMGGSGLILWFPTVAAKIVPGSIISLAHIAHSDEALLAALAIFLWHFYNVHLKPTIFPMSWVWLTGKLSVEALYEEHREEYERQFGARPPAAPRSAPTWHVKRAWSVVGVATVLLAGAGVIVGNVSSVREQIAALRTGHEQPAGGSASPAGAGPGAGGAAAAAGAYDAGFDAFSLCLACHDKERFERGGDGRFPHVAHFEANGVERDCKKCHAARWHARIETKTTMCLDCHEAAELGLGAER